MTQKLKLFQAVKECDNKTDCKNKKHEIKHAENVTKMNSIKYFQIYFDIILVVIIGRGDRVTAQIET